MNDSVIIPSYFNIKKIDSYYLNELFSRDKFVLEVTASGQSFFSLSILREIYQENKNDFVKIVSELVLRGFMIQASKPSALFPKSEVTNNSKLVRASTTSQGIDLKKIDFKLLRLGSLLQNYRVESSRFFENIPIEGFLALNQSINLELLANEFQQAGFEIKEVSDNNHRAEKKSASVETSIKDFKKQKSQLIQPQILKKICAKDYLHTIMLSEVLVGNSINDNYLSSRKITHLYQLTPVVLQEFEMQAPSVCKALLNHIDKTFSGKKINPYLEQAFEEIFELGGFNNELTEIIFSENKFNLLKNFLFKNKIIYLKDFTPEIFNEFTRLNGVGAAKLFNILDVVNEHRNSEEQPLKKPFKLERLYLVEYMSRSLDWKEYKGGQGGLVDSQEFVNNINNLKKKLVSHPKKVRAVQEELERSIKIISGLDVELIGNKINFWELYGNKSYQQILIAMDMDYNSQALSQERRDELNKLLTLPLKDLTELSQTDEPSFYFDVPWLVKQILWLITGFKKSLDDFDVLVISSFNDLEKLIYYERIIGGLTLEEVGKKANLTRERIRQIERKGIRKINNLMTHTIYPALKILLKFFYEEITLVKSLQLSEQLICLLKKDNEVVKYERFIEVIYLVTPENEKIIKEIVTFQQHLPAIIDHKILINQILKKPEFPSYISKLLVNDLENLLEAFNYKPQGNKYISKEVKLEERIIYVLSKFDNQTIDFSKVDDLLLFREVYQDNFPNYLDYLDCTDSSLVRKLRGSIDRMGEFIMTESSTFQRYNYELRPKQLIEELANYLTIYFEEEVVISYKKLYSLFEKKLAESNITPFMMYYLLKYSYEESFEFGKGNTMYIYANGAEKITTEEIIYNKVVSNGGQLSKKQISDDLGFEMYTIEQAISISAKLVGVDSIVNATDLDVTLIPESLNKAIVELSQVYLEKHKFVSIEKLFYELKFNVEVAKEMLAFKITEPRQLLRILKIIQPELEGHTKFLYRKREPVNTSFVILSAFRGVQKFTRQELIEVGEKFGYSSSTIYVYINVWQRNELIVEINEEQLVLTEALTEVLEQGDQIKKYLEKLFLGRSYLSLANLKGFRRELPNIRPWTWTPELIRHVAKHVGYCALEIRNITSGVDPLLIVIDDSSSISYGELLKQALQEYTGNLHQAEVCRYLLKKELLIDRKNGLSILPEEVLAEGILTINEIGVVKINV